MKVYHGTSEKITKPDLTKSRVDIDFGAGFYLTKNKGMATKWAANKSTSIVNEYELDLTGLKVVTLDLNKEWLDFVASNRGYSDIEFNTDGIDVIIGPTADDKLFGTLEQYFQRHITSDQAIRYLNVMGFSNQIVLKTEKAIENLKYVSCKTLNFTEQQNAKRQAQYERTVALTTLAKIIELDKKQETKQTILLKGVSENYEDIDGSKPER